MGVSPALVDASFASLAMSLNEGPLVKSPASKMRIQSAIRGGGGRGETYEMNLYCQSDQDGSKNGMKVVCEELIKNGIKSAKYKSDIAMILGCNSKAGPSEYQYTLGGAFVSELVDDLHSYLISVISFRFRFENRDDRTESESD